MSARTHRERPPRDPRGIADEVVCFEDFISVMVLLHPEHEGAVTVELLKDRVYMSPFWEDDLVDVIERMGADRVVFGSDWPHMEGLPQPCEILAETAALSEDVANRFLYANTAALNERRPL